ncbi:MAG TPA: nuclease-related domain-containing protein [Candidatus Limnocylindrales bacterium]|jgi:hypothetical protein|nr:nuclease-related domain-containing protein [Candidatus Limnocylindrales bacterium]
MQVIRARRTGASTATYLALVGMLILGTGVLGVGLALAYVALTTPLVADLSNAGAGRLGRPLGGALVWALALLIPGTLVIIGLARVLGALERSMVIRGIRPRPASAVATHLSDDYTVVQGVTLPDQRVLPEVVVGPHGILLVEELPPARATRRHGPYWEVRLVSGRWRPIENPVDRAGRDAERLRNWIANEDGQFAPRTYAAVVTDGHSVERTSAVAVLTGEQLPAFLDSMPPARQMDAERRGRIVELLRSHI